MKWLNRMSVRRLGLVSMFVVAAVLSASAQVWGASPVKVAVVDPQVVLEKSKAGKRALGRLKEYANARKKILEAYEEELRQLEADLKNDASSISEEAKRKKQEDFREKVQAYQKQAQGFNQELAIKQKELVQEYMGKISEATKVVAQKRGVALVVDKGSENTLKIVIYNHKSLDLTNQVVKEFDRRFK